MVLRNIAESYFGPQQKAPESHNGDHYLRFPNLVPKTLTYLRIYESSINVAFSEFVFPIALPNIFS